MGNSDQDKAVYLLLMTGFTLYTHLPLESHFPLLAHEKLRAFQDFDKVCNDAYQIYTYPMRASHGGVRQLVSS